MDKMNELDLRLGNYVSVNNGSVFYKIAALGGEKGLAIQNLDGSKIKDLPKDWIATPIDLTNEILIRLGFEEEEICCPVKGFMIGYVLNTYGTDCEYFCLVDGRLYSNGFLSIELEYLHDLQNCLHALTKKEITI